MKLLINTFLCVCIIACVFSKKESEKPTLDYNYPDSQNYFIGERLYDSIVIHNPTQSKLQFITLNNSVAVHAELNRSELQTVYFSWTPFLSDSGINVLEFRLTSVDGDASIEIEVNVVFDKNQIFDGMKKIKAGTFWMGDTIEGQIGLYRESFPPVQVKISEDFWIDSTEVTLEMYQLFAPFFSPKDICIASEIPWDCYDGANEGIDNSPTQPVVFISYSDALGYCNWKSQLWGLNSQYNNNVLKKGFGLPTEAEWELAARGGLHAKRFPWGNDTTNMDSLANTDGKQGLDQYEWAAPVGMFPPNNFGLYDMFGNVTEWVSTSSNIEYSTMVLNVDPEFIDGDQRLSKGTRKEGLFHPGFFKNEGYFFTGFRCIYREGI